MRLQALKASSAQPGFRAEGAMAKALYGEHAYGRGQPTEAGITSATPAALRRGACAALSPRACPAGDGRACDGSAGPGAGAAPPSVTGKASGEAAPATPAAPRQAAPARLLLERPGSVQATLRLGRLAPPASDPDLVPLRVATAVLGDGFTSRINLNLREDKGYTYGASLRVRPWRDGGALVGGADVRNEVTARLAHRVPERVQAHGQ